MEWYRLVVRVWLRELDDEKSDIRVWLLQENTGVASEYLFGTKTQKEESPTQ